MKKLICYALTFLMLFASVVCLSACGGDEKTKNTKSIDSESKIYRLEELYESGEINREQLLTIAYYANLHYTGEGIIEQNKDLYPENYVPEALSPETLDDDQKVLIEKAVGEYAGKDSDGEKTEFYFNAYFGRYGDYIAVGMRDNGGHFLGMYDYSFEGVHIIFPNLNVVDLYFYKV